VLAIAGNRRLPTAAGPIRADVLAAALPRRAWQRLSAGPGAKGQRYYDWAWLESPAPAGPGADAVRPGCWWLLIRRSRRTRELAFYRCYHPTPVRLTRLVAVAGRRWTIEESFQAGKGLGRPRRAPGPPLAALATLDPAGHARPRPARRPHRQ
jgi:hypothetical protein